MRNTAFEVCTRKRLFDGRCPVGLEGDLAGIGQIKTRKINLGTFIVLYGQINTLSDVQIHFNAIARSHRLTEQICDLFVAGCAQTNKVQRKVTTISNDHAFGMGNTAKSAEHQRKREGEKKFFHGKTSCVVSLCLKDKKKQWDPRCPVL